MEKESLAGCGRLRPPRDPSAGWGRVIVYRWGLLYFGCPKSPGGGRSRTRSNEANFTTEITVKFASFDRVYTSSSAPQGVCVSLFYVIDTGSIRPRARIPGEPSWGLPIYPPSVCVSLFYVIDTGSIRPRARILGGPRWTIYPSLLAQT